MTHPYVLIEFDSVDSTNEVAKRLISEKKIDINTAIISSEQTQGKGQFGNIWKSETGKNIILSLVIHSPFKTHIHFFNLINAISIACYEYIQCHDFQNKEFLKIKWVNDLYYETKKIGGVLIENKLKGQQIEYTIIGIGLNINQVVWQGDLQKNATSLALICKKKFDLKIEIHLLLSYIYKNLQILVNFPITLFQKYNQLLFRKGEEQSFFYKNKIIKGIIIECERNGYLVLKNENQILKFNFGELKWIF